MGEVKLTVAAGARCRMHCPVAVKLQADGVAALALGDEAVPFQIEPAGEGQIILRFIVGRLAAGQSMTYVATCGATPAGSGGLSLSEAGGAVTIHRGDALETVYHYADPEAARPYWYPLLDPHGNVLTRGFPMVERDGERQDHPHHRSLWVAYGEVNGTDNWSQLEGHATQTHEAWHALAAGAVYALLDEQLCWRSNEGTPVLDEHRVWRYYDLPESTRLIDVEIDLTASAGVGDVTFGDTKEGGLISARVTTSMDVPKGRIENAIGGVNEDETWGKQASWCDYSGPVKGNWVGLALFDHPSSFRYPTSWHVRNYGLMTANAFGLSHFTHGEQDGTYVLPDGETMKFRYRVYLHAGDAAAGQVGTKYHDYANPPVVKVE